MRPYDIPCEELRAMRPQGIILSGGPASIHLPEAPRCDPRIFDLGIPVLGVGYGMQLLVQNLGGSVENAELKEYGKCILNLENSSLLYEGLPGKIEVWMSPELSVSRVPPDFEVTGRTDNCSVASIADPERKLFGVQFYPEVKQTLHGDNILKNFLFKVCGCQGIGTRVVLSTRQ